jgi:hypothetical protein
MSAFTTGNVDSDILRSVIEHVFMPPKLPQRHPTTETEQRINLALCNRLIDAAKEFVHFLPASEGTSSLWNQMIEMMETACYVQEASRGTNDLNGTLSRMAIGGTYR